MVYVGGSAIMFDAPDDTHLISLAKRIYEEQNGVLSAICHGVAGLVNIKLENGEYLVKGKVVNSFTNSEEGNEKYIPFLIERKLRERGASFKSASNWQEYVAVSGRLITGQNPASCKKLVAEIIKKLEL